MPKIGGRRYRASPAAFGHTPRAAVSRRSGAVPLARAAVLAHEPSPGVGSLAAHRERESLPETHSAYDVAGDIRVRWHQLQCRRGACGSCSGTGSFSSVARGGTETPPTDGTYRHRVRSPFPLEPSKVPPWLIDLQCHVPR
jgi:hypothetical protein